ncbi:hypothetical protein [Janthinobacterium sp. ZB1P44]|uniref:hypothetical protein n=1 Tax=Janthinobacterium sp. ZB1P44 TaxID=3424192 RepID=UPI003F260C88
MKYISPSNHLPSATMMHPAVGQRAFTDEEADHHMDCPMDHARISLDMTLLATDTRIRNSK